MRRVAALAAIAALSLTGCSSAFGSPGVLNDQDATTWSCLGLSAYPHAKGVTFAVDSLHNIGDSDAVIDSVSLTEVRGFTVTKTLIAPVGDLGLIGLWAGNPPVFKGQPEYRALYESGVPVDQHPVIKPGETGNVVFGINTSGGSSGPVVVKYHDDGGDHTWTGGASYEVAADCKF